MINSISSWATGIVIAIVIGTILQIIIPNNKNKKYIKVVIGIYTLFCIISPVVGKSINLDELGLNEYITINSTTDNSSNDYNERVKKTFEQKVKLSIKQELHKEGYDSNNIEIIADDNYNISKIKISNTTEYKEDSGIVNKVEISIKEKPAKGIAFSDKYVIIQYIKDTYNVHEENIEID